MKKRILFFLTFLLHGSLNGQNFINELVINHEQTMVGAGTLQTVSRIRTLDSLHVEMIIIKSRLLEATDFDAEMGMDTLLVRNGCIVEQIQYQNCIKVNRDSKNRVTERFISNGRGAPINEIQLFQYDSLDFPIYSCTMNPAAIWSVDGHYQYDASSYNDQIVLPHYDSRGILDTLTYAKNPFFTYAVLRQDSFKNGDSVIVSRRFFNAEDVFQQAEYFVRTVHSDTVQIRFYRDTINQFQEYTRNFVNGLEVESYGYERGVYAYSTKYNRLGLPLETVGLGVSASGSGNFVSFYEYYSIDPKKKNNVRLVKMK